MWPTTLKRATRRDAVAKVHQVSRRATSRTVPTPVPPRVSSCTHFQGQRAGGTINGGHQVAPGGAAVAAPGGASSARPPAHVAGSLARSPGARDQEAPSAAGPRQRRRRGQHPVLAARAASGSDPRPPLRSIRPVRARREPSRRCESGPAPGRRVAFTQHHRAGSFEERREHQTSGRAICAAPAGAQPSAVGGQGLPRSPPVSVRLRDRSSRTPSTQQRRSSGLRDGAK